jgi:tight adherence protein C
VSVVLILAFALLGVGMTLIVRALGWGSLSGRTLARRIALYGYSGRGTEGGQSGFEPKGLLTNIAETAGQFLAGRTRSIRIAAIRQDLLRAGLHNITPFRLLGYQAFAAVIGPLLAVLLASAAGYGAAALVLAGIVGVVIGWMAPHTLVRRRGKLRVREIDYQLPDLIDLLVVTVEAGLSFAASLRIASEHITGELGVELRLTLQEQNLGLAANEALQNILSRVDTPALRSFVQAVLQGETLGVSIGQILRNIADDMRKRRRAAAEERAHKAPIKMLFPLIFFIFPAMFVVILVPAVLTLLDAFK